MNGRDGFMSPRGRRPLAARGGLHARALLHLVGAVDDEGVARGDALAHRGDPGLGGAERDLPHLHRLVRLHHVDEGPLGAALDRLVGHQHRALQGVDEHSRVHELVRVEHAVGVVEGGLDLDGAGALIDLVVDRHQRAAGDAGAPVAVEGLHRDRARRALAREDRLEVVLGNGEQHRDRLHLGQHHEAARVVGVHHVPRVDEPQPGPAGDRREDAAVGELEADGVDVALVGLDGRRDLRHAGRLGVELLLGDEAALDQGPVALEVEARVAERGLVLRELALDLHELGLEGPRIDLGQHVAGLDDLAFLEGGPHELAVDPAADRHRVQRGDRAEAGQVDGEVAGPGGDGHHRDRARAGGGGLGAPGSVQGEVAASGQEARQDDPDDPDPTRRPARRVRGHRTELPGLICFPSHAGPPLVWLRL
jgi:hypothetical protein